MRQVVAAHSRSRQDVRQTLGGTALRSAAAGSDGRLVDLFTAGFEDSDAALVLFAPDDSIAFASKAFIELFDVQPNARSFADVMRHCYHAKTGLKFAADIERWLSNANAKRRSVPHRCFEVDLVDGRWLWANETSFAGGWIMLVISDITVLKSNEHFLKMARDAAEFAAGTDSLTGLPNRRQAMSAFDQAVAMASASGSPLSLTVIDLDHFKRINDRFGHAIGDQVLCHFAETGKRLLRSTDLLARIGGEEFMLLMLETGLDDALRVTERMRERLASSPPIEGLDLSYTMSAGIATFAGETPDQLFQAADRALYRAKDLGRNCIEIASG